LRKKDLRILKGIEFKAQKGELITIIGQVGSGKSSLLHAILGEMKKIKGNVRING
jgi:ABC-type branched-subunit amino acid transport system ATPase component